MVVRRWFARSGLLLDVVLGNMCSITLLVGMVDCGNSRLILNYFQSRMGCVCPCCLPIFIKLTCEGESELIEALSGELRPYGVIGTPLKVECCPGKWLTGKTGETGDMGEPGWEDRRSFGE